MTVQVEQEAVPYAQSENNERIYRPQRRPYRRVIRRAIGYLSHCARMSCLLAQAYTIDILAYFKWSRTFFARKVGNPLEKDRARMSLLIHSLEKGMCLPNPKKGFGKEKAWSLYELTEAYVANYGVDEHVKLSLGVLSTYQGHSHAAEDSALRHAIRAMIETKGLTAELLPGGTKACHPSQIINCYEDVYRFVQSRCSVREFSGTDIADEDVIKAVRFAQTAPSACNRQACKVHTFSDRKTIRKLLDSQLGDQGWALGASRLFVITALHSHFDGLYERYQMYIDGGMFAMEFVMGLHSLRIAACCKMYVRTPSTDKQFYLLTGISGNEVPIMLILAGHYQDIVIQVPCSHRVSAERIVTNHN